MTYKVILVTSIPGPYRIPVYDIVSEIFDGEFLVIYCDKTEPNRRWKIPKLMHPHVFLKDYGRTYFHNDSRIFRYLYTLSPDVVITCGFKPTFLYAFVWSMLAKKKHIPMTDGTLVSEHNLNTYHKIMRRIMFRYSSAFIGASMKSARLYEHYGVEKNSLFISPLSIDLNHYSQHISRNKEYDIIFSGRFVDRKMPFFVVDICLELQRRIRNLKVLLMGEGVLRAAVIERLKRCNIDFVYEGFVKQGDLPTQYAKGRLLLFPTKGDPWGVVANEALAVGVPVITCENAGVAHELVKDGINGYVLSLDYLIWTDRIENILNDSRLYTHLSKNALALSHSYTFERSAYGILQAIEYAIKHK